MTEDPVQTRIKNWKIVATCFKFFTCILFSRPFETKIQKKPAEGIIIVFILKQYTSRRWSSEDTMLAWLGQPD